LSQETKQQLLRNAVKLAGMEDVAIALKVPASLVDAWMNGQATMPDRKLLLLADFLEGLTHR
jgi:hypothetical protein